MARSLAGVKVIVPWLPSGCRYRSRAWRFVSDRLGRTPMIVLGGAPWRKGDCVNRGVAAVTVEVIAVMDADVLVDLEPAIQAVRDGAPWAVPHSRVLRLTESATEAVYGGASPKGQSLAQRPYEGFPCGGAFVARRDVLLDVPMDERFVGWGQEDMALSAALKTLYGPAPRMGADLHHLWHPPQERLNRVRGSHENWALWQRYAAARYDPDAMRRIVEEARCSHSS